ncbi:MAG: BCCT family transporter [Actinomycetaceae bacterium]|nr:BCCT family transporter [Actinomycetaceae bacterium]
MTSHENNNYAVHGVARGVFYPSTVLLLALVAAAIIVPSTLEAAISWASTSVINNLSWYYVLVATGFVFFVLVLAFSRLGDIKLGDDDTEPDYSLTSWFAMLFAAGMGIGLVFYGAGEPLSHFASPRPGSVGEASFLARDAMSSTFLHWGLHPWAIYVIVGLSIAYTHHRRKRPISIRWTLEPVLGEDRVKGAFGDVIDTVAVLGTVLGIATSLGFGVNQVAAGIEYLTGFESTRTVLVVLVVVISSLAALSVATGLDNGIKFLSNLNLVVAALLAFAIAALGPTTFILSEFVQDIGYYFNDFFKLAFQTLPFEGIAGTTWLTSWTTYYWGWWMSWSPFVGIFIARISRGRTIREFILGVLAVPTLVTFMWFAIMGGNGLYQEMFGDGGLIGEDGLVDVNTVLFQSFEALPFTSILSGAAMIVVIIFFVTSSDSGSYVMSMLSTAGNPNPRLYVRLTWAIMTGAVTAVMIGTASADTGMAALQSLAILAAFPFSFIMIGMSAGLWRKANAEHQRRERAKARILRDELVHDVSAHVVDDLSIAADEVVQQRRPRSPIPVAPEIVSVLRGAKRRYRKRPKDRE